MQPTAAPAARFASRTAARLLAAVALAAAPAAAAAADHSLTVFGGWRTGGSFVDASTGQTRSLDGSATGALAIDRAIDATGPVRLLLAYQDASLPVPASAAGPATSLPIRIAYVHLGGTRFLEGQSPLRGPFVSGGLGFTAFSPSLPGYSSEVGLSGSLGAGYLWPLSPAVALRVEVRGYLTLLSGEGALFCSGGCVVALRGDAFGQFDLQLGLSVRF
jgi:hypothetical protein